MRGYGGRGNHQVHVLAPGYQRCRRVVDPDKGDRSGLSLKLARGLVASGRLLRRDDKPAAGVYVAVVSGDRTSEHDWHSVRTGADGRFQVAGIPKGEPLMLVIRRDGWATVLREVSPLAARDGVLALGDVVLEQAHLLTGRVHDRHGSPVSGHWIECMPLDEDRRPLWAGCRRVVLDSLGRYQFHDLAAGSHAVCLRIAGDLVAIDSGVKIRAGERIKTLDLRTR
jgi:hypothetical protein